ncbi:thiamine phosphate synthase [Crocinitomix algicola]|uniref:thiamine phosphate synthase n=1 Tax=Crocinitomix algicola TaxID=1740263 RepID=UPI00087298A2|nr:thiamine phosphate synthase [Crocinitomix algicola]
MELHKLQYITNGASHQEIIDEVKAVLNAGCKWIQLRIKQDELDIETIAKEVQLLCANTAVFLINDRVELAKKLNADGVHLGLEDMPISQARHLLGEGKIIGGTANQLKDCLKHQLAGANYIGLGPFRTTNTKKKLSPILGLKGYNHIVPKSDCTLRIPVFAIGGLTLEDIKLLKKETGITGVAVSGLVRTASNKKDLVERINKILN